MTEPQKSDTRISRRVLVADDDPFYREIASATLVDAGFDVVTAGDGREALEVVAATSIIVTADASAIAP